MHLLGERTDMSAIMAALDIAVLCSAWGEGFPNAIGEAMACGVPCLATDVGDCRTILAECGEIVPPRDPAALAAALRRLLQLSANCRRELGASGRQRIAAEFSLGAVVGRYRCLYDRLTAAAHPLGFGLPDGLRNE